MIGTPGEFHRPPNCRAPSPSNADLEYLALMMRHEAGITRRRRAPVVPARLRAPVLLSRSGRDPAVPRRRWPSGACSTNQGRLGDRLRTGREPCRTAERRAGGDRTLPESIVLRPFVEDASDAGCRRAPVTGRWGYRYSAKDVHNNGTA